MRHRHRLVIAIEKRGEIAGEIIFILVGKRTHDAEIDAGINAVLQHKNIAGMHVGMEKTIAKHLREKYFHAVRRESGDIDAVRPQLREVIDRQKIHALEHQRIAVGVIEIHFRHVKQCAVGKIAFER